MAVTKVALSGTPVGSGMDGTYSLTQFSSGYFGYAQNGVSPAYFLFWAGQQWCVGYTDQYPLAFNLCNLGYNDPLDPTQAGQSWQRGGPGSWEAVPAMLVQSTRKRIERGMRREEEWAWCGSPSLFPYAWEGSRKGKHELVGT